MRIALWCGAYLLAVPAAVVAGFAIRGHNADGPVLTALQIGGLTAVIAGLVTWAYTDLRRTQRRHNDYRATTGEPPAPLSAWPFRVLVVLLVAFTIGLAILASLPA